ncbi:Uncharacterised protein [Salmonella enterica subsp. enterica serovar Typhi]|nr:Uncharacterised protein [Salmonella enterica subsp. enterica serovar Typhi]CQW40656.1 Uncharacterised protein [Salmonella enterica subsp. enterica serovar Typhi]
MQFLAKAACNIRKHCQTVFFIRRLIFDGFCFSGELPDTFQNSLLSCVLHIFPVHMKQAPGENVIAIFADVAHALS